MSGLIKREELLKELDSLYREEDCEIGDGGVVTSSWATVDYGEVVEKVNQAPTIHAIPLDKVKKALQDENNQLDIADSFDYSIEDGIASILRIIGELAESEE